MNYVDFNKNMNDSEKFNPSDFIDMNDDNNEDEVLRKFDSIEKDKIS